MCAQRLKKGDKVVVITGKDKGVKGEIERIFTKTHKALVKGVNVATRHVKPSQNDAGGLVKKDRPVDISNLMIVDPSSDKPTRVGFKVVDGRKVRFAKRSGTVLDLK
ncbi:MAG: 50S ribosomal protein L24 [Holosporales bacterium]|jgi:large subunit ribosomal protein L24|nr:50S ribosomal protein L24 [Holosporales bacterium]